MNFILSTDTTCDLTLAQMQELGVSFVSLAYRVDGEEYGLEEGKSITLKEYYDAMRSGKKTGTSMVNVQQALDYFEPLLKSGKDVLHICFASALSGTYESMMTAAEDLNEKYSNKVYVVDSKCACAGEGLLVMLVSDYAKTHAIEECVAYAEEVKNRVVHLFTVDTLKYLAAGGRVSKATAMVGNILKIKPVLCVDEEGRLVAKTKVIGRKASLNKLIEKTVEKFTGESKYVIVSHADCEEDANLVANALSQKLGVTVEIGNIGYVIGGHAGPGTLAIFFVGKDRVF